MVTGRHEMSETMEGQKAEEGGKEMRGEKAERVETLVQESPQDK